MCFVMRSSWFSQYTFHTKNLKTRGIYYSQLMVTNYTMCTSKILTDLCFTKQRIKAKHPLLRVVFQCFSSKNMLTEHKKFCLSINGAQLVRLEKRTIEFKNYFKQIPVSFKIYANFGCNIKGVESYKGLYSKKYKEHVPCSLLTNLFVLIMNLLSQ